MGAAGTTRHAPRHTATNPGPGSRTPRPRPRRRHRNQRPPSPSDCSGGAGTRTRRRRPPSSQTHRPTPGPKSTIRASWPPLANSSASPPPCTGATGSTSFRDESRVRTVGPKSTTRLDGSGAVVRIVLFRVSATYRSPFAFTAIPWGVLNRPQFSVPIHPGQPAIVVTTAPAVIFRIVLCRCRRHTASPCRPPQLPAAHRTARRCPCHRSTRTTRPGPPASSPRRRG